MAGEKVGVCQLHGLPLWLAGGTAQGLTWFCFFQEDSREQRPESVSESPLSPGPMAVSPSFKEIHNEVWQGACSAGLWVALGGRLLDLKQKRGAG